MNKAKCKTQLFQVFQKMMQKNVWLRQWKVTAVLTKPEETSACYMKFLFTAVLMVRPDKSWVNNSFKYLLFYKSEKIHEEIANLSIMLAILSSIEANWSAIWHGLKKTDSFWQAALKNFTRASILTCRLGWALACWTYWEVACIAGKSTCPGQPEVFFGALFMLSRTLFWFTGGQ